MGIANVSKGVDYHFGSNVLPRVADPQQDVAARWQLHLGVGRVIVFLLPQLEAGSHLVLEGLVDPNVQWLQYRRVPACPRNVRSTYYTRVRKQGLLGWLGNRHANTAQGSTSLFGVAHYV